VAVEPRTGLRIDTDTDTDTDTDSDTDSAARPAGPAHEQPSDAAGGDAY